jgi:hypothetical protein
MFPFREASHDEPFRGYTAKLRGRPKALIYQAQRSERRCVAIREVGKVKMIGDVNNG